MSSTADLDQALSDLAAGRAPDVEAGRRIGELARAMARTEAGAAMLKRRGVLERDRLLLDLAAQHFARLPSVRAQARALLTAARRYEASGWLRDRGAITNPRPPGSIEARLWAALKAWPEMPSDKHLRNYLAKTAV